MLKVDKIYYVSWYDGPLEMLVESGDRYFIGLWYKDDNGREFIFCEIELVERVFLCECFEKADKLYLLEGDYLVETSETVCASDHVKPSYWTQLLDENGEIWDEDV